MTLKKKTTRRIVVDGRSYRWIAAPNDEGLAFVVEHESGHGQRVVAKWYEHGTVISPGVVRDVVVRALENGWRPDQPGPELVFWVR